MLVATTTLLDLNFVLQVPPENLVNYARRSKDGRLGQEGRLHRDCRQLSLGVAEMKEIGVRTSFSGIPARPLYPCHLQVIATALGRAINKENRYGYRHHHHRQGRME